MLNIYDLELLRHKTNEDLFAINNTYNRKTEEKEKLLSQKEELRGYLSLIGIYRSRKVVYRNAVCCFLIFGGIATLISLLEFIAFKKVSFLASLPTSIGIAIGGVGAIFGKSIRNIFRAKRKLKNVDVDDEALATIESLKGVLDNISSLDQELPKLEKEISNFEEALEQIETTILDFTGLHEVSGVSEGTRSDKPLKLARQKKI